MSREEQIKNMARAIHINCHKGLTSTEAEMIAKWCYREIDRASLKNAREIFAEIEEIRLKHIKKCEFFRNGSTEEMERKFYEGAEWGLRQLSHWIAELKKKYTEDGERKDDGT